VKAITELHGGTVHVESGGRGQGAQFTIRLPQVASAPAGPDARPAPGAPRAARRVLVVDDNRDAADSLAEIVEMLGHAAIVAYDGAGALAKARADAPDVVLCDIGLPGMSGYDVARSLRDGARNGVLLVAVTGYAQPQDVTRALDAGFDRHIAKPASIEDIERLLR
jgi:CheY-like chemotaxis protein